MNNYDLLLEEIDRVSNQKEQGIIAKAFSNSQYIDNELMNYRESPSLNKYLNELSALGKKHAKHAKQAEKISRENRFENQARTMLSFRGKLKKGLMMKSITPQQAMTLENRFNNVTAKLGVAI